MNKEYDFTKIKSSILKHEEHFLARFRGDRGFLKEIYTVLLSEFPEKRRLLKEAEALEDYESMAELAHALRSSGATIGVEACSDLAARIEEAAGRKKVEEVRELNMELDSVMSAITTIAEERLALLESD